jgi:hypothetical protein
MNERYRHLPFVYSRRRLLPALVQEALVTLGMTRGGLGCRLSELGSLPNGQLACVRPMINFACEILVDEDQVWARDLKAGSIVRLFSVDEREKLLVFNLFDGEHNLAEIGGRLAQEMDWDEARAFACARELFLDLVGCLVCLPREPVSVLG